MNDKLLKTKNKKILKFKKFCEKQKTTKKYFMKNDLIKKINKIFLEKKITCFQNIQKNNHKFQDDQM